MDTKPNHPPERQKLIDLLRSAADDQDTDNRIFATNESGNTLGQELRMARMYDRIDAIRKQMELAQQEEKSLSRPA